MALSRIERLDLVARSRMSAPVISCVRVALVILSPLFILLAVNSTASARETVLVAVLGVGGLITAVILWLDWRFKVYALCLFCFLFAISDVISNDHPRSHTLLGWIAAHSLVLLFVYYGGGLWLMARRYALAVGSGFREERELLNRWMDEHTCITTIEFPSGSFWTGYWTYRIFNPGDCWIVAVFKRGTTKLRSCRVYASSDVSFSRLPSGRWQVDIGGSSGKKKSFVEVDISSSSLPMVSQIAGQMNV